VFSALVSCAGPTRFVGPAPAGGPAWRELTSEHIVLRTDLDSLPAERIVRELELVQALLPQALGKKVEISERLEVVAFATKAEMFSVTGSRDYVGEVFNKGPARQQVLLAGNLDRTQATVIAHEMAHVLAYRIMPRQPRWFAEGLATYLSSVATPARDGSRTPGLVPRYGFLSTLQRRGPVPVRDLLAWTRKKGEIEHGYYATSWLLVRYLDLERHEAFEAFQGRLAAMEDPGEAWNAVFPEWSTDLPGGPEALGALLRGQTHDYSGSQREVRAEVEPRISGRLLSPAEVYSVRLRMPHTGQPEELKSEIALALLEDPAHVQALTARAALEGKAALEPARRAVAAHPEDPDAWRLLARAVSATEEREAALRKAVQLDPTRADHLLALAGEIADRDPREAESLSGQAAALAPWSGEALSGHAWALACLERCAEAIPEARRALDLTADQLARAARWDRTEFLARVGRRCEERAARADALVDAAQLAAQGGRASAALPLLVESTSLDPGRSRAWDVRGVVEARLQMLPEAVRSYEKALEVDPENPHAWEHLGLALGRLGKLDRAETAFRRLIELDPEGFAAHLRLGVLLLDSGRAHDALPELKRALVAAPGRIEIALEMGRALLALGDEEGGLKALEEAVRRSPMPEVLNQAAYYLADSKRHLDRASKWSELSLSRRAERLGAGSQRAPSAGDLLNSESITMAWDTLGWIRLRQGRLDEAERYVLAAERASERATISEHLGEILERRHRMDEAMAAYARAAAAPVPSPAAKSRLASLAGHERVEEFLSAGRVESFHRHVLGVVDSPDGKPLDAEVLWVLAAEGGVAGVLPGDGQATAPVPAQELRGLPHRIEFPDRAVPFLVLRGRVRCTERACTGVVGDAAVPSDSGSATSER
jgi:tetratricopeptide (TPR) repeat protein